MFINRECYNSVRHREALPEGLPPWLSRRRGEGRPERNGKGCRSGREYGGGQEEHGRGCGGHSTRHMLECFTYA